MCRWMAYRGESVALERGDLRPRLDAELRVEVRERLVQQEDLRPADDRAAHRHPLALAARERLRLAVEVLLEVEHLRGELNAILAFVEQLAEAEVDGVEPMTSVAPMAMKVRKDDVTDGGIADTIMANAPARQDHFFLVPKVVE